MPLPWSWTLTAVPPISEVSVPPEFMNVNFFFEYCASRKKLLVITPL